MKPYYSDSQVTLYCCDWIDALAVVGTVDHVITDPPYNLRAEDIALDGRAPMKRDFGEWDQEWEAGPFLHAMSATVRAGGSLLSFTSDRLLGEFRKAEGFKPRGTIVWVKDNPAPHPRPAYVSATEWIVWLQREGAAAVWNGTGYTPNVVRYGSCSGAERTSHPTQKPEGLLLELVSRHTNAGETICDPFAGSGTTLVAAKRLGRKAIGVEINEAYCEIAAHRCSQGSLAEMFQ